MTDAEKCRIHGWTVGTILEGDEGYGPDRIVLTAIGEERIYARQITENGEPCEYREANWTLSCRDWKPVGFETAGFAQSEIEQLREKTEELECTLSDEEVAHQDTLRLWNESQAEVERLRVENGELRAEITKLRLELAAAR